MILYELQGLSYEEIADVVGCPLGTVKSRIFNARVSLRIVLEATQARREEDDLALRPVAGKAVDHEAKFSSFAKQVKDHIGTLAADRGYVGLDINALWQQTCRHIVAGLDAATRLTPVQTLSLLKLAATHVVDIEGEKAKLLGDISLGQDESVVVSGSGSFDDQVIQLPNAQALLDALPADVGPAYGLRVWCGLSHKKIATTLGIEPNTVRSKLSKARELLIEALSKEADQLGAAVHATLEAGGEGLSKVKGAEVGSEEAVAFIADKIGLADHQLEVAEVWDSLVKIVPEPAPQPAAAPPVAAPAVPATPPAPVAPATMPVLPTQAVAAAHLGRQMTELELAVGFVIVQSALVKDDDVIFRFLRTRQDVLADLVQFANDQFGDQPASEAQIENLIAEVGKFVRHVIPGQPVADQAESA